MKINPKVSVIVPCYNNEKHIEETLISVKKQTYPNVEIIVVNDGSTDNSIEIINKNSFDVKIINQENHGPSHARNRGSEISSGKYLLFVDGDDIIDPSYISKCVDILESNETVNIVYTKSNYFDAINKEWKLPEMKLPDFLISNCIPVTAMIRKLVFEEVGRFDENLRYIEDWELWIRIVKKYGGVHCIPEKLFFYRKSNNNKSLTDTYSLTNIESKSRLYIYNKHYEWYELNGLDMLTLFSSIKYKKKYYSIWYKKLFYCLKN